MAFMQKYNRESLLTGGGGTPLRAGCAWQRTAQREYTCGETPSLMIRDEKSNYLVLLHTKCPCKERRDFVPQQARPGSVFQCAQGMERSTGDGVTCPQFHQGGGMKIMQKEGRIMRSYVAVCVGRGLGQVNSTQSTH